MPLSVSEAILISGDAGAAAAELPLYEAALRAAGYQVEPDPGDSQALRVAWPGTA